MLPGRCWMNVTRPHDSQKGSRQGVQASPTEGPLTHHRPCRQASPSNRLGGGNWCSHLGHVSIELARALSLEWSSRPPSCPAPEVLPRQSLLHGAALQAKADLRRGVSPRSSLVPTASAGLAVDLAYTGNGPRGPTPVFERSSHRADAIASVEWTV